MSTIKKLNITPPDGWVIDIEKSDLSKNTIVYKEINEDVTYDYIVKSKFHGKKTYFPKNNGDISFYTCEAQYSDKNNASTELQVEKLMNYNVLCNIAQYLNNGWELENKKLKKYFIYYDFSLNEFKVALHECVTYGMIYFKSRTIAEKAIEIFIRSFGREELIKTLSPLNY